MWTYGRLTYPDWLNTSFVIACERRRIFSVTGSAENNVCDPELENEFCDVTTFVFSLANHIAW